MSALGRKRAPVGARLGLVPAPQIGRTADLDRKATRAKRGRRPWMAGVNSRTTRGTFVPVKRKRAPVGARLGLVPAPQIGRTADLDRKATRAERGRRPRMAGVNSRTYPRDLGAGQT